MIEELLDLIFSFIAAIIIAFLTFLTQHYFGDLLGILTCLFGLVISTYLIYVIRIKKEW